MFSGIYQLYSIFRIRRSQTSDTSTLGLLAELRVWMAISRVSIVLWEISREDFMQEWHDKRQKQ